MGREEVKKKKKPETRQNHHHQKLVIWVVYSTKKGPIFLFISHRKIEGG